MCPPLLTLPFDFFFFSRRFYIVIDRVCNRWGNIHARCCCAVGPSVCHGGDHCGNAVSTLLAPITADVAGEKRGEVKCRGGRDHRGHIVAHGFFNVLWRHCRSVTFIFICLVALISFGGVLLLLEGRGRHGAFLLAEPHGFLSLGATHPRRHEFCWIKRGRELEMNRETRMWKSRMMEMIR